MTIRLLYNSHDFLTISFELRWKNLLIYYSLITSLGVAGDFVKKLVPEKYRLVHDIQNDPSVVWFQEYSPKTIIVSIVFLIVLS